MTEADTNTAAHRSASAWTRRATYQDVLDAPAHRVAEIIDGTLYTQPRPAPSSGARVDLCRGRRG